MLPEDVQPHSSKSGWGGGGLGGKPAYGAAVGIFPSPDGMGEGLKEKQPTALR